MKMACGRCWDYDCSCTPKELEKYNRQCELNRLNSPPIEYSNTIPKVSKGNIVLKDGVDYYVRKVVNGVAYVNCITNVGDDISGDIKLKEPYLKYNSL